MSDNNTLKALPPNELSAKWLGACGLNSFHIYDSSARLQMLSQHLGQMLVLDGSTPRQIQTGMEREYGKYTYRIEMPCDGLILDIIRRYQYVDGPDPIRLNPQTIVIYENVHTKEIGMIDLVEFCSNHQYFGFRYKDRPGLDEIKTGAYVKAGTVLRDSPSITDEGDYKFGVQANVAFMTHPACSEDGFAVSDAFLPKLGFRTFETRTVEWGRQKFALNLYGDDKNYKPFPDIGDVIRPDGLLMALRDYGPPELAVVEQSVNATQRVDFTFDSTFYANGAGGRIVDVRVHHDKADENCAVTHMDGQVQKYDRARRVFYQRLNSLYLSLTAKRGGVPPQITPQLQQLLVQAQSVISEGKRRVVTKQYRKARLDTYRVEFTIEYSTVPNMGAKITDLHGGKGVKCQIIPAAHMPVDEHGNRADVMMDPNATINRANPGRVYEQYYNAAARDAFKSMCVKLGNVSATASETQAFNHLQKLPPEQLQEGFDYLMNFYRIVAPQMARWFEEGQIQASPLEYLAQVVGIHNIGLHVPTDHENSAKEVCDVLEDTPAYRPLYGPVTYIGNSGVQVTTVKPVRIAPLYIVLLEKVGDDWSAVSSGKLQLFGVLGQLTKSDKNSRPYRPQPTRVTGEGEVRLITSNCGEVIAAELMDRNNNPASHKAMVTGILSAPNPSNIDNLVDRSQIPYGGSKPLQFFKHLIETSGFVLRYQPHNPNLPKVSR